MRHPLLSLLLVAVALPTLAAAQTADNVLLVINENSPASIQVGDHYASKRGVPEDHILRLKTATTETIQRVDFDRTIDLPIGAWLTRQRLQDSILYIVLTKGVPLRIAGTGGLDGTVASVDSELTLLYRRLLDRPDPVRGRVANPYYLGAKAPGTATRFSRVDSDLYLVTRLDGYTVEDVLALIDRGMSPTTTGAIVLDQKATLIDRGGDAWLDEAAERIRQTPARNRLFLERTRGVASTADPVIGYYSWGSNDPANQLRRFGLKFSPGAIGAMFVSTDGRTFVEPPATWKPSVPEGGPVFGGSFQSLTGDLIRDGITGVAGHVAEPYLDATIRPQVLFPAYLAGFNLAESFYLAMPFLGWQTIVIGDPLTAPFPRTPLAPDAIAKGLDAASGFPVLYTERRLDVMGRARGLNPAALKLMLKMEAEASLGVNDNAEKYLVAATELEPRFVAAHIALASRYGRRGDVDAAIDRFRRVIAIEPDHAVALNDLAWSLADKKNQPKEALPYAERALRKSQEPAILDTVGWTHHLLGDDANGVAYLERALKAAPGNAEILLHTAIVHAALGRKALATEELAAALKINPALGEQDDVKALQARLAN